MFKVLSSDTAMDLTKMSRKISLSLSLYVYIYTLLLICLFLGDWIGLVNQELQLWPSP